jgi:hypothetical protein
MDEFDSQLRAPMIESLGKLGERLEAGLPSEVIEAAQRENPWFTAYYLREAVAGIRSWLWPERLQRFVGAYAAPSWPGQRVGIIAAGNLPLVGFHDVLVTLLSGHQAYVKYARRDQVMMTWLRWQWQEIWPSLPKVLHEVQKMPAVDFLLATGSDNSARYFRQAFPQTPKLIRHHRYSVAWLRESTTDEELRLLNRDLLLYNGLGCRNVSCLLLAPGFDPNRLQESLRTYMADWVNPLYLERLLYMEQMYRVLGKPVVHTPFALLQSADEPSDLGMGQLSIVRIDPEKRSWADWEKSFADQWQCIVGKTVYFGQSQRPDLGDFADGVDTMALLGQLPSAR